MGKRLKHNRRGAPRDSESATPAGTAPQRSSRAPTSARIYLGLGLMLVLLTAGAVFHLWTRPPPAPAGPACLPLAIVYPLANTIFPPDIVAPKFRWTSAGPACDSWQIAVSFSDGSPALTCLAATAEWTPSAPQWQTIKSRSVQQDATVTILGLTARGQPQYRASVTLRTSRDPVEAPLFYREVPLPFSAAVKDPSKIRWRFGPISSPSQPPIVMEKLPVCGNCHSFSADGTQLGMDIDYANDKGSYVISKVQKNMLFDPAKIITWSDYKRDNKNVTFGLLSQISPDGRYVVSTVKDRSVFVATPDLEFSQLFFPIKGILTAYDRQSKSFCSIPGADDPKFVQSNAAWSPDGQHLVFARAPAYQLHSLTNASAALLTEAECDEFLKGGKTFQFDLYQIPFNHGNGGTAQPLAGASGDGMSNFFPKYSPDGKWIVFCKAKSFMLLQPDSELFIVPAQGGTPRRLAGNTRRMNSWHTWSPNSRWLAFTSKANGPYSQIFLTHIDELGQSSPPVELAHFTASDRAANIPEFVNQSPDAIATIREAFVDDVSLCRAAEEYIKANDGPNAFKVLTQALLINPDNATAQYKIGAILALSEQHDQAIPHFRKALEVQPDHAQALCNLGCSLANSGQHQEAMDCFEKSFQIMSDLPEIRINLATAMILCGRADEAIAQCQNVLETSPDPVAKTKLKMALTVQAKLRQAVTQKAADLRQDPNNVTLLNDLAWLLATCPNASIRDGRKALELAQQGVRLAPAQTVLLLDTLAAAYAQTGAFPKAVQAAQQALDLALAQNHKTLAAAIQGRLTLYQDGRVFLDIRWPKGGASGFIFICARGKITRPGVFRVAADLAMFSLSASSLYGQSDCPTPRQTRAAHGHMFV